MLSFEANDFVIASAREQRVEHVTITPDASNTLVRGTILANDGDGTYSVLAKTAVASASMAVASHAITIKAQNVDPATIVVKSSGTALVLGTDYTVALDDATGYTVITLKSASAYYAAEALDVAYSTTNIQDAEVILAEDVEAGNSDVVATVYVAGDFVIEGLTAGVALTAAAKLNLKNAGIYLVHGIEA